MSTAAKLVPVAMTAMEGALFQREQAKAAAAAHGCESPEANNAADLAFEAFEEVRQIMMAITQRLPADGGDSLSRPALN